MDEADLCAVCNSPGRNFYAKKRTRELHKSYARKSLPVQKSLFPDENGYTSLDDLPDHQRLQAQLRRIFLLQQIFEYPVHDVTTLETLQIVGNPSKWFEICLECSLLVDTGIEVLGKLKRYEREHKRINDILKRKLLDSTNSHHSLDIKHQPILEQRISQHQNPEVSRARMEFRNKIRKIDATMTDMNFELAIKNEPEPADLTDYENDYPTFDADFEDVALSPEAPPIAPKEPPRKRKSERRISIKKVAENLVRGRYPKRTKKVIKKSKSQLTISTNKKVINKRKTKTSLRAQMVEKPRKGRKRTSATCADDEENPEKKKYSSWFFDKCPEYLDMNLIKYPPRKPKKKYPAEASQESLRFPCPSCDKTFNSKFYTIAHIHRTHLGVAQPWSCNMCSRKFQRDRTFYVHVRDHNAQILKTCEICHSYATSGQRAYDIHVINHQKTADTPTCHICQNSFNSFKEYVKHVTDQHKLMYSPKKDASKCEMCSKMLTSRKMLKFHLFKKHNVGENDGTYPMCPECGETFLDENCIAIHKRWKHTAIVRERVYPKCFCEHCGKEFNATFLLNAHIAMVHIEEPQNCKLCGLEIKNAKRVDRHMNRVHKEAKTMTQEELEEYVRTKNEEMAYHCRQCSERFAFSVQLHHHYRYNHPETTDKFKCDICGKGFSRQSSVKRHVECSHMKVTMSCEDCGKEFSKDSLAQHRRNFCAAKRKKEAEQAKLISTEAKHDEGTFAVPNVGCELEVDAAQEGPIILYPFISQSVPDN